MVRSAIEDGEVFVPILIKAVLPFGAGARIPWVKFIYSTCSHVCRQSPELEFSWDMDMEEWSISKSETLGLRVGRRRLTASPMLWTRRMK